MTRNTKSLILQLLILLFLPKTLFGQVDEGLDLTKLSKLNDYIEEQVKAKKLAGAEFLIARNNKIVPSNQAFSFFRIVLVENFYIRIFNSIIIFNFKRELKT